MKRTKKWIKALVFISPLIGLIIQHNYFKVQLKQYEEQQTPKIDCQYKFYTDKQDYYKFSISNVGLIDCKDIWAQESIFLIFDGDVYKGDGIPHYNFFVYEGSRKKMWDLERSEESKNPGPKDLSLPLAPHRGANSWPPEEASGIVPADPLTIYAT